jgi:hypothetical protein
MALRTRVALIAVAFVCAACGGRVSGDPPDSGVVAMVAGDSGTGDAQPGHPDTPFGICPAEPPAVGDACTSPNQGCVYLANGACVSFVCDGSSHWSSTSEGC